MTTHEELPSIKTAVELEARRRKRVFATFLALLLIPVAIGAYAILKAPSETDLVVARVTPIVEEKIAPRVDDIVERRAEPMIERKLNKSVDTRVQPLEQRYRILAMQDDRIQKLEARVQELEQRLQALDPKTRIPPDVKIDRPLTHVPKPVPQ